MVTNVAAVHLEAFKDVAAIAVEKASIFDGMEPGGVAVINADHEHSDIVLDKALERGLRETTFGQARLCGTVPDRLDAGDHLFGVTSVWPARRRVGLE